MESLVFRDEGIIYLNSLNVKQIPMVSRGVSTQV